MTVDSEFKNLIPPLSPEERQGLESSLLKEGCRDALVLWGEILVDGHNRYEICTQHDIPFKTVQREFKSRDEVIEWIILNQFGLDDFRLLSKYCRVDFVELVNGRLRLKGE